MFENVELFNVAEAKKVQNGYALNRFPEKLQGKINPFGSMVASYSCGCEIRFVKEEAKQVVRVNFIAENGDCNVVVYRGDRPQGVYTAKKGEFFSVDIGDCPTDAVNIPEYFKNDLYDHNVVRIVFQASRIILCGIETFGRKIRPPKNEELPKRTMLAYGSSITHGSNSVGAPYTYASTAARNLSAQVLNKGLGGSCFCEKDVADWFADEIKYDFMTFECGTNMYDVFSNEEIFKREKYMLEKLFTENPDKYIFLITPPMPYQRLSDSERYKALCEGIKKVGNDMKTDRCVIVNAEDIETDSTFLCTDRIHPSTEGHMLMGMNLAKIIKPYLD